MDDDIHHYSIYILLLMMPLPRLVTDSMLYIYVEHATRGSMQ